MGHSTRKAPLAMERLSEYTRSVSLAPRGLAAGRFIKSIGIAHGDPLSALAFAEGQHQWRDTSSVVSGLKAVGAMTSDGILPNMIFSDFIALPRARSLLDRIEGWRRVPMNVPTLKATGDAAGAIVPEGRAMPITAIDLTRVTLTPRRAAAAIVTTEELLRSADRSAEMTLAGDLGRALAEALDRAAFDPSVAGSLSNGATTISSTGATLSAIDADLQALLAVFDDGDAALDAACFVLSARTAAYLSLLRGSGGALAYPTITARGGSLAGIPVFVSGALTTDDSPPSSSIVLLDPTQVLLSDDEQVSITTAKHAAVEMLADPTNNSATPTATNLVSLFQVDCIAIAASRFLSWLRASDTGVAVLTDVSY